MTHYNDRKHRFRSNLEESNEKVQFKGSLRLQFNRRVGNQIYTRKLATGIPGYSTRFDAKN